jgi:hypothetical protein
VYQGLRYLANRVDQVESCDWQCVQGCYNTNQTYDIAEDCFQSCGCYDEYLRTLARKIESKASNISRNAGRYANSPSPLSLAAVRTFID